MEEDVELSVAEAVPFRTVVVSLLEPRSSVLVAVFEVLVTFPVPITLSLPVIDPRPVVSDVNVLVEDIER